MSGQGSTWPPASGNSSVTAPSRSRPSPRQPPSSSNGCARRAIEALRALGPRIVVTTSLHLDDTPAGALDILAADETGFWRVRTPNLPICVNGSGDLFAALFFHHWLKTHDTRDALSRATSSVHAIVKATLDSGSGELSLIATQEEFTSPAQLFAAETV